MQHFFNRHEKEIIKCKLYIIINQHQNDFSISNIMTHTQPNSTPFFPLCHFILQSIHFHLKIIVTRYIEQKFILLRVQKK